MGGGASATQAARALREAGQDRALLRRVVGLDSEQLAARAAARIRSLYG